MLPAGVKCLLEDEAVTVCSSNHSRATQDSHHTSTIPHVYCAALLPAGAKCLLEDEAHNVNHTVILLRPHLLFAGVECLLEDEAVTVGGSNHSHATHSLVDTSISNMH
jgi:hypothetical protein